MAQYPEGTLGHALDGAFDKATQVHIRSQAGAASPRPSDYSNAVAAANSDAPRPIGNLHFEMNQLAEVLGETLMRTTRLTTNLTGDCRPLEPLQPETKEMSTLDLVLRFQSALRVININLSKVERTTIG
jgi:hypothetical protein